VRLWKVSLDSAGVEVSQLEAITNTWKIGNVIKQQYFVYGRVGFCISQGANVITKVYIVF